jgi:archaellin
LTLLFSGDVDLATQSLLDKGGLEYGLYVFAATGDEIASESTDERRSPEDPYVGHLTFLVHNSAPSGTIDLSGESTVLSYFDSSGQTFSDLPFLEDIANTQVGLGWGILGDSGPELGPNERAEIQVNLFGLPTLLEPRDKFTVEIRPVDGQELTIEDKQVPSELNPGMNRLD